jgi:hypothetical protein
MKSLANPSYAHKIWRQIESYWEQRDFPSGQRFLGSVKLSPNATNEVLDIVQTDLSRCGSLTRNRLQQKFGSQDFTWIKVLTFAMSEYAYIDDSEHGYWQGLCDRFSITKNQTTVKALQQVFWEGVEDLGLIRSDKANRYVATLWLQSGIPQQNLGQFAELVQVISSDYDWWDLAHADPSDLAQLMCDACQQRFPPGKLLNFLNSSCPEDNPDEESDPIAGQLLQGLATVAQELERRGESPEILRDAAQRSQILSHYSLPNTFFLRSWDSLIEVLTPRPSGSAKKRAIASQRKKPFSLVLDIADTLDIQLVLPEQHIYRKDWKRLQAGYCTIPEVQWEGDINLGTQTVQIPELRQSITQATAQWTWQLRSHMDALLLEWHHAGISPDQLCLIFDAETGEQLLPQQLGVASEIFLFTPKSVERSYGTDIEIIDNFVPCSIAGWYGHLLQRTDHRTEITLVRHNEREPIVWDIASNQTPLLKGLRIKGRQIAYLHRPTVWYPPLTIAKPLNILVEDLQQRQVLTQPDEQVYLEVNESWQEIPLIRWITGSGTYLVRLWNASSQWSATFAVQDSFQLMQPPAGQYLEICDRQQIPHAEFPVVCPTIQEFWLEVLTIKGLWPLETARFVLTNGNEMIHFSKTATTSGHLDIDLAPLRDALSNSPAYALDWLQTAQTRRLIVCDDGHLLPPEPWLIPNAKSQDSPPDLSRHIFVEGDDSEQSEPQPITYWIQLNSRKSTQFKTLFERELKKRKLGSYISLYVDKSVKDIGQIILQSENYKSELEAIITTLNNQLRIEISLIEKDMSHVSRQPKKQRPNPNSVTQLRYTDQNKKVCIVNPFQRADHVSVTSGPFKDFEGDVIEVMPKLKRLRVSLSIFGREVPVEVEFSQVQKQSIA